MSVLKLIDKDIVLLQNHLKARGIVVDELLFNHLRKISDRLSPQEVGVKVTITSEKEVSAPSCLHAPVLSYFGAEGSDICRRCGKIVKWDKEVETYVALEEEK